MFRHVDIFSASEPSSLAGITSPATSGVSSSRSTEDGVDYVLLLRLIRPIARGHPGSTARSGLEAVCSPSCRGPHPCGSCSTCSGFSEHYLLGLAVGLVAVPDQIPG
ncbi:hypothetical protein TIFTF001_012155 [Ficus carica]|uniref:Uncharacterized protein n=1 Tax=Ficus carica TaxID=3494 RepID=A0AA87ZYH4_FICCA|nr:hypothetical protein TIFTF001_012155 [Ficus carica]